MQRHAIACGHAVTAEAAEAALDAGGNAVDAALSAGLAAMVAEPVLAGLLGGGFLSVREPNGRTRILDFFVQTPQRPRPEGELDIRAIEAKFGTADQTFHVGPATVATPGVAAGMADAAERYGTLPLKVIADPAMRAAREGVRVTDYQAELSLIVQAILTATPACQALFCDPDTNAPLPGGSLWKNPEFADVLEVFGYEGARFVTEGEVAQALIETLRAGGHLLQSDLSDYRPRWRDPLRIRRGKARISLNPPPSLGGTLIAFALDLLDSAADMPAIARALELTGRARIDVALDGADRPEALLDEALLSRYRKELAGRGAATQGTTQISVIDAKGLGAALTLSNGAGSGLVVPGTGIMPNNMLGEEDLLPGGLDRWTPDERLASMMCPLSVEFTDGSFAMMGSGGSNRIRSALSQVLFALIDRELAPEEAVIAPRCHVEAGDTVQVDFEDVAGEETRSRMLARWPDARSWPDRSMFFGGVHVACRDARGGLTGAGDPRRAGVVRIG